MGNNEPEIKLFITTGCPHCEQIKKIVESGRFNAESIDLIDLSTPEGYPYLEKLPVKRVPTAMKGDKVCELTFTKDQDGEILLIDCDKE